MKSILFLSAVFLLGTSFQAQAQNKTWNLEDCINYALSKNIQVQKTLLTNDLNQLMVSQAEANRLPSLNASANENFSWSKTFDYNTGLYGSANGSNSTNFSMSSSVSLYNGLKLANKIKQAQLDLESGKYNSDAVKESIGLSILNAYLQVLYDFESVGNAEKQIVSTNEQLNLAKERMDIGVISMSDYLQIKSQLATEKSTLASAQSQLTMGKVNLEQLMELPVDSTFEISSPDLEKLLVDTPAPNAQDIYNQALGIKPQIKNVELAKESAQIAVDIAKADAMPSLSMSGGLGTSYSSLSEDLDFSTQVKQKVSPQIGLSLQIPIFQKKQIRTNIATANIAVTDAELTEINTRNDLRKSVEQACADVASAKSQYSASLESKQSAQESYDVATEKYQQGLINSVDYLIQKTNLITSESKLLQSKYNLIFSYKIVDFYKGIPLAL